LSYNNLAECNWGIIIGETRMNKKKHHEIETGKNILVGLLFITALLFVCIKAAWPYKETSILFTKYLNEPVVEEDVVVEEEVEEEIEEVVLTADMPMIAFTFDDGPGKYTDELLTLFEENDAKASFFVLGSNVIKYPEVIKRMDELGFEIGNHSYSHAKLTEVTPEYLHAEVEWTNDELNRILGHGTALVRPPYGAINETVRTSVAYPFAFWSVDTLDWELKDAAAIAEYILNTVQDGDVVLLHDIYGFTLEAMRIVVPKLQEQGYQLVTFSEMMEVHGITMENGEKYFNCK